MGLIDDASLAFTAALGASKPGTAYSLKPTDGSGDFAFTRADDPNDGGLDLAATFINQQGYIEKGYENLLTQSNTFSSTDWKNERLVSPIQTGFTGYDGSNNAWKLIPNAVDNTHRISQENSQTGVKTFSVYLKQAGYSKVRILAFQGNNIEWKFDLDAGVSINNPPYAIDYKATDVGNDWWRLQLTTAESHNFYYVFVLDDLGNNSFVGDGIKGVLIQDAMLNEGLVAMPYIESGASKAQKGLAQDEPRFTFSNGKRSLLLEPERTNLFADSEYFGSWLLFRDLLIPNSTTSPEGILNAYRFEETATTGEHTISSAFPMTAGLNYVASVFVKAGELTSITLLSSIPGRWSAPTTTFSLSPTGSVISGSGKIEPVGNDWYRCSINGPCILTSASTGLEIRTTNGAGAAGNGLYIYGAQVEEGSYPSSYIPTYGTTKTRFADNAIAAVTNTASRTYFLYGKRLADEDYQNSAPFYDPNDNLSITFWGRNRLRFRFGGATNDYYTLVGDDFKIAISYDGVDCIIYINGQEFKTRTFDLGNLTSIFITGGFGAVSYNQTLYFPTALSEDECIELTTL